MLKRLAHVVSAVLSLGLGCLAVGAEDPAGGKAFIVQTAFHATPRFETPSLVVSRAATPPKLDGKLDDAIWQRQPDIPRLVELNGGVAQWQGKVWLAHDDQFLYVAYWCFENDFDRIDAGPVPRDKFSRDCVEFHLDPGLTRAKQYQFAVNVFGSQYDSAPGDNVAWNAEWSVGVHKGEDYWTMECAIPAAAFGIDEIEPGMAWGANFARSRREKSPGDAEDATWIPMYGSYNVKRFGTIIFSDRAAFERLPVPVELELAIEREEYDALSPTGRAVARVSAEKRDPEQLAVRLELKGSDGKTLRSQRVEGLQERTLDMVFDLADVPPGAYTLHASVLDRDGQVLAETTRPLRRTDTGRPDPQQRSGRIPLLITGSPSAAHARWPLSGGLPFARGVLNASDHLRIVDAQGQEVPCQINPRMRWDRDGSWRWVGIDLHAAMPAPGQSAPQFFVEYGPNVRRAAVPSPLQVRETADAFHVDTGAAQLHIPRQRFTVLSSVKVAGKELLGDLEHAGLYVVDNEGAVYRSNLDPQVQVTLEESGPVRAVFHAEGWMVKEGSTGESYSWKLPTDKLCKFVVRIEAYRGSAFVKVTPQVIFTFDSNEVRLKDIGLHLPVAQVASASFVDGDWSKAIKTNPAEAPVSLVQLSDEQYVIETYQNGQATPTDRGSKASGMFSVTGAGGTVSATVRDFWQLFPKELAVDAAGITIHIWPKHGRTLSDIDPMSRTEIHKLWFAHMGEELNLAMPRDMPEHAARHSDGPRGWVFYMTRAGLRANAMGVSTTNEILLSFEPGDSPPQTSGALAEARLHQDVPHLLADPVYLCSTDAMGRMHPAGDPRFARADITMENAFRLHMALQQYTRDYGMFNYFDAHSDNSHFGNGVWGLNRLWDNNHHGLSRAAWLLYARSGKRFFFDFARPNALHHRSVDVCHFGANDPACPVTNTRGNAYHVKGLVHWGGDHGIASHYGARDHNLLEYLLTGNLGAREAWIDTWGNSMIARDPHGTTGRDATTTLAHLSWLYQTTWDARHLLLVQRFADSIFATPLIKQSWPNFAPFFERYYDLSRSQIALERSAEFVAADAPGRSGASLAGALYFATGDTGPLKASVKVQKYTDKEPLPDLIVVDPKKSVRAWFDWVPMFNESPILLKAMDQAGMTLE